MDKGVLRMGPDADLSALIVATDGYSSVSRGSVVLYPVTNDKGILYFSRAPLGDNAPGNQRVLVDFPS